MIDELYPDTILGITLGDWCYADDSYKFRVGQDATGSVEVKHQVFGEQHELSVRWSHHHWAYVSSDVSNTYNEALSLLRQNLVKRGHIIFSHLTPLCS